MTISLNKRKLLTTVFILIAVIVSPAQENFRHLIAGTGFTWHNTRDEGISPFIYSGRHNSFNAGISKRKDSYSSQLYFSLYNGQLHPVIYPELSDAAMKTHKINLNYFYLRNAGKIAGSNISLSAGGSIENSYVYHRHLLFDNSSINNSFYSKVSLSAMGSFPFTWEERDFILNYRLSVPVVTFIVRPSYAMSKPIGYLTSPDKHVRAFFESLEVSAINSFRGLRNRIWIERQLGSRYGLKLSYEWNYFSYNGENTVKSGTNTFMIHTFFDF